MVPSDDLPAPTAANKYTPLFDLGQGGMGKVVLAVVRGPGGFNKLQVVKSLRQELADNPEFLTMFLDEARLSARINHPNVVQTNEVGFDGSSYFLAMEYLEGQSLEAYLIRAAKRGPLPINLCVRILVETCAGLHHAHELVDFDGRALNVVHRDVSPHNIFVTYDGQTKVLDFGIAKAADSSSQTRTGIIKGKVAYMAPEQAKSGAADRRADVFALGAILWRILAGHRLWKNMTDVEVYHRLAEGQIPSPVEVNKDASPELVAICMKALAAKPEDRYATAAELQSALEDFLDASPERTSHRAIGKDITELFRDRRQSVKTAIETRLSTGLASTALSAVPQMPNSVVRELESSPELSGGPNERGSEPRVNTAPLRISGAASMATAPSRGVPSLAAAPPPTSRNLLLILAALLSIMAAVLVVIRARLTPSTPPTPTTVTVDIYTDPANAVVKLDDMVVAHNATLPRDNVTHKLTVEAPGYKSHAQMVELASATLSLHVALESVRTEAPAESPVAAVSAADASRPTGPAVVVAAAPVRSGGKGPTKPATAAPDPNVGVSTAPAPAPAPSPTPSPTAEKGGLDLGDPWGKKK